MTSSSLQGLTGTGRRAQLNAIDKENKSIIQMKYWKHRILFSIVESIVASDTPTPGLSSEAIKYLEKILMDARLRKPRRCNNEVEQQEESSFVKGFGIETNGKLSERTSRPPDTSAQIDLQLLPKVKSLLKSYISMEVKSIAQSIVKTNLEKLKGIRSEEEKNSVEKNFDANSLQGIVQAAIDRDRQQKLNEAEIEKLTGIRDKELLGCQKDLASLKDLLAELVAPHVLQDRALVDAAYTEHLKIECDNLLAKTQMTKIAQLIDENPPELISEYDETYKEVQDFLAELEKEISDVKELEENFNALSPEFQQLLREWEELEEDIKTKEWALQSLENFSSNDSSFNASFSC